MKTRVHNIIQDLRSFKIESALNALRDYFDGESDDLDAGDMKEIVDAWIHRFFPESCIIQIDGSDDTWKTLFQMAHEKDITLNQLVVLALEEQIERMEEDVTKLTKEGEL